MTYFIKTFRCIPSFYILWNYLSLELSGFKSLVQFSCENNKTWWFGGNSLLVFSIQSNKINVFKFLLKLFSITIYCFYHDQFGKLHFQIFFFLF